MRDSDVGNGSKDSLKEEMLMKLLFVRCCCHQLDHMMKDFQRSLDDFEEFIESTEENCKS